MAAKQCKSSPPSPNPRARIRDTLAEVSYIDLSRDLLPSPQRLRKAKTVLEQALGMFSDDSSEEDVELGRQPLQTVFQDKNGRLSVIGRTRVSPRELPPKLPTHTKKEKHINGREAFSDPVLGDSKGSGAACVRRDEVRVNIQEEDSSDPSDTWQYFKKGYLKVMSSLRKVTDQRRDSAASTSSTSSDFEYSDKVDPKTGLHPLPLPRLQRVYKFNSRQEDEQVKLECTCLTLTHEAHVMVADMGVGQVRAFSVYPKAVVKGAVLPGEDWVPWCATGLPSGELVTICFKVEYDLPEDEASDAGAANMENNTLGIYLYRPNNELFQTITDGPRSPTCAMGNADNSFTVYDDHTHSLVTFARHDPANMDDEFVQVAKLALKGDIGLIMYIAGDPYGFTYASDWDRRCVSIFNRKGRLCRSIGLGTLSCPRGLCVDPEGRLFVVDTDAHALFYMQTGTNLYKLDCSCRLNAPTDIAVDQHKSLYLLEAGGKVSVFKYN